MFFFLLSSTRLVSDWSMWEYVGCLENKTKGSTLFFRSTWIHLCLNCATHLIFIVLCIFVKIVFVLCLEPNVACVFGLPILESPFGSFYCLIERLINGFVTRFTRRVPVVEKELPTLPGHLSSPPVFSGVRVTRFLVLCVCFVDRCLSFFFWPLCCLFFFYLRILITHLVFSHSSWYTYTFFLVPSLSTI